MILDVGKYRRNPFYFDCFLSDHDREREYLFIGGYAALEIRNILQFLPDTEDIKSYSHYLNSIECFLSLLQNKTMDSKKLSQVLNSTNILSILIQAARDSAHHNDIPDYIMQLFNHRCKRIEELTIFYKYFI